MADYTKLLTNMRTAFRGGKTMTYEWRRTQLRALLNLLDENRDRICEALWKDLHKSTFESLVMEVDMVRTDLVSCMDNLQQWMKPTKVKAAMMYMFDKVYTQPEPYGVALVISPWNYPIQLSLMPVVGAIAAGNCVVLKPSEIAEATALVLQELFPKYLDTECIACVTEGITETTALLRERWDYIFYTGNSAVGKIIMKAAAEHLTPVTLELGGKSPVYVDSSVDLGNVASRIWWAKVSNAGQTCIAPDYVMCTKDIQDALVEKMKDALKTFYPEGPFKSTDYPRMISDKHYQRVKSLIHGGGKVALGGDVNEADKFVAPTVLTDVSFSDPVMQEEILGPVLPIVPVKDENEAVQHILDGEKPLALYVFSSNKAVVDKIASRCSSGSLSVNDCLIHVTIPGLPFGGVGHSGMGSYHGKHSFDTFSHTRGCLERRPNMECLNRVRYPPFNQEKLKTVQKYQGHGKQPRESGCTVL